jgi:LuxR family maltose regulon positive regulatory protein
MRVIADAEACRIALAHRVGAPQEVPQWQDSYNPEAPLAPLNNLAYSHVLLASVLIDSRSPTRLAKARRILDRLRELAENTHNTRALVEVLALQALLCEAEGKREAALDALDRAATLAEPGGMIRVFSDCGPKLAALLRLLLAAPTRNTRRANLEFIARLLAAIADCAPARSTPDQSALIEPLTYRELEVLELLRERLMHKEIGQKLDISPMTVKRHATNIYEKLGVGNRRDAVTKAEALGLLPAPPKANGH